MNKYLREPQKTVKTYVYLLCITFCMFLLFADTTNRQFASSSQILPSSQSSSLFTSLPSLATSMDSGSVETEMAEQLQRETARLLMQSMSLDQKLGQLIVAEYLGNNYQTSGLQYMIEHQFVSGILYQASNHNFDAPYNQISKVKSMGMQAIQDSPFPLLIATDQEGGLVNRLASFHGDQPSAQELAASGDPYRALAQGAQTAQWLQEMGINVDLAPVVDVHTVDPPVLQSRMFGRDPHTVASYAGAFLDGLQTNGVAGCLKHFPGLGAITSDPHYGLPTVARSKAQLDAIDLAPYKLLLHQSHPAMIMATDVLVPAIDPLLPAELSPRTINGILRGELGYEGVVISDGLYMQGISEYWSLSQAAVMAILAGDDLIEGPYTPDQVASVVTALKQAMQHGQLSIERINQSVQRILEMKI